MITEQGTIKTKTALDERMQRELNGSTNKFALALIIVGAIGAGVFLVLEMVAMIFTEWDDSWIFTCLVVFAIFLGLGIGLKVLINKNMKTVAQSAKINEYEFFSNYFTINEFNNGENVGTAKIYNNQITKSLETKNYLFFYLNAAAAYPVEKCTLTEDELNTLRGIFRLPVKGKTVGLAAETVQPEDNSSVKGENNELS